MRKLLVATALLALVIAVGVPVAVAGAHGPGRAADAPGQQCIAERASLGAEAFAAHYDTADEHEAYARCVVARAREHAQRVDAAVGACRAEHADPAFAAGHDGKPFAQFYGAPADDGPRALATCLRAKLGAEAPAVDAPVADEPARPAVVRARDALRSCRAERRADRDAFRQKYGSPRGRHALRRCVKAKLKADRKERRRSRDQRPAADTQPESIAHAAPAQPQVPASAS